MKTFIFCILIVNVTASNNETTTTTNAPETINEPETTTTKPPESTTTKPPETTTTKSPETTDRDSVTRDSRDLFNPNQFVNLINKLFQLLKGKSSNQFNTNKKIICFLRRKRYVAAAGELEPCQHQQH